MNKFLIAFVIGLLIGLIIIFGSKVAEYNRADVIVKQACIERYNSGRYEIVGKKAYCITPGGEYKLITGRK